MELKTELVIVGEKEFYIRELTCLKRNALLNIIGSFTFAEVLGAVIPILDEMGIKLNEGSDEVKVSQLVKLGLQNENIWGGLVACLVSVLHIGPEVICLSLKEELTEEIENYVTNNLTIIQEPAILSKIIEINKLPDTIKNYKSLLTEVRGLVQTTNS